MSVFCYKPLKPPVRLGDTLRLQREQRGWNIEHIEYTCHIPRKYVAALEHGRFSDLPPAKPHRLAYVKQYAQLLGLNANECASQFCHENGLAGVSQRVQVHDHKKRPNTGRSISVIIQHIAIALGIILFTSYLVWQVKGIIEPPTLNVVAPLDGSVVSERTILVEGDVETGARLTVNGQEVAGDSHGQFRIPIDVVEGLNTLTIAATKKHGKTTQKFINVIVKPTTFNNR
jgi:cytoskeletal protein RodZ